VQIWGWTAEFDTTGAVGIRGLGTAEEEESIAEAWRVLEDIGADIAIPGGPGVPGVPGIPGGMEKDGAEGIHEVAWLKVEDTVIVELEELSAGNEKDWEIAGADVKLPASCETALDVFWKQAKKLE